MNTSSSFYLFNLPEFKDERGQMCVAECEKNIPFVVKRIFYDFNNRVGDYPRGNHANRNSKFVFICLSGSCIINVNDGRDSKTFLLNSPSQALFVDKMVWKTMSEYSADSILLIMSDCHYDSSEYIRNFEEFLEERKH